jgi:type I pantothenate kinase
VVVLTPLSDSMSSSSAYHVFTPDQWSRYRSNIVMTLSELDIASLRGVGENICLQEAEDIYLPLCSLLSMLIERTVTTALVASEFLDKPVYNCPYVIGVAGSVAVGKSTTARLIKALLSNAMPDKKVDLVTTDGFLYPNAYLQHHDLMGRKGFPESYDLSALLNFLTSICAGKGDLEVPIYSHHYYDVMQDEKLIIDQPDVLILEGLNILQTGSQLLGERQFSPFVSDFLNFSIFVDAKTEDIRQWYLDRLLSFSGDQLQQQDACFHFLCKLHKEELLKFGAKIWQEVNELNLLENILPFRQRANLILHKTADHSVSEVLLRSLF